MRLLTAFAFAAFGLALSFNVQAADAPQTPKPLSDAERAQIEQVVRDLLTNKEPQLVFQAAQLMQQRQQEAEAKQNQTAMSANMDKLYKDPTSPVSGNPKGDITLVEFFDYQCGYCKMAQPTVQKLLQEDKKLKIVYKEYPILGPESKTAALAALASVKQGKYEKFHEALMALQGHLTADMIYDEAKKVGLNVDKLRADAQSPEITKIIDANIALGQEIGVRGTPMFFLGDRQIPGAAPYELIKKNIEEVRAAKQ